MFRYIVVEYCFEDDSYEGKKNVVGAYETKSEAHKAAGEYIRLNVKKNRKRYRDWIVRVYREQVFFPIKGI